MLAGAPTSGGGCRTRRCGCWSSGSAVLYVYAARVIGPKVVPAGHPGGHAARSGAGSRSGIVLLWVAADWPVHDIGEQYLYFVHMSPAHRAHPRGAAGDAARHPGVARPPRRRAAGRVDAIVHRLARPVPAGVAFNGLALLSHWQVIVNGASSNGLFHYGMHTALVTTAVLFWIPVCGPFPELRISPPAQMVYLFVASIVPTVPGAWLTFADGAVYSVYDIPDRLWGLSVTSDQQIAGLLMKLGAGQLPVAADHDHLLPVGQRARSAMRDPRPPRSPTTRWSASSRSTRRPAPRSESVAARAWGPADVPPEIRDAHGRPVAGGRRRQRDHAAGPPAGRPRAWRRAASRAAGSTATRSSGSAPPPPTSSSPCSAPRRSGPSCAGRSIACTRRCAPPERPGRLQRLRSRAPALGGGLPLQGPRGRPPAVRPAGRRALLRRGAVPARQAPRHHPPGHRGRCGRADRAAFEAYWKDGLARIEMDDVTRRYLRGIADLSFVVAPLGASAARSARSSVRSAS